MAEANTTNNPEEGKESVSLYAELDVSDERSHEINDEIHALFRNSDGLREFLHSIPEEYDRESILVGVFLAERILSNEGRLLPIGMTIPSKEAIDEMLADLIASLKSGSVTPRDVMDGDPNQN